MASRHSASCSAGSSRGKVARLMDRAEDVQQIGERVHHPAGVEVAESEHAAVGAARVVRKDGLEGRVALRGRAPLLAGVARDADHADLAVGPRLLRDPLDQVVVVGVLVAIVAFGLRRAARLRDDMDVAVGDEAARVAGLDGTEPQRRVSRLRRQDVGDVGALDVLVVQGAGIQDRVLARLVRPIDIDRQAGSVPHGHDDVAFFDHLFPPF